MGRLGALGRQMLKQLLFGRYTDFMMNARESMEMLMPGDIAPTFLTTLPFQLSLMERHAPRTLSLFFVPVFWRFQI